MPAPKTLTPNGRTTWTMPSTSPTEARLFLSSFPTRCKRMTEGMRRQSWCIRAIKDPTRMHLETGSIDPPDIMIRCLSSSSESMPWEASGPLKGSTLLMLFKETRRNRSSIEGQEERSQASRSAHQPRGLPWSLREKIKPKKIIIKYSQLD